MIKNICLIIVCNICMYLIFLLFRKIKNKKNNYISNGISIYQDNKDKQIITLNKKIEILERKMFIQEIFNHVNAEREINEKI